MEISLVFADNVQSIVFDHTIIQGFNANSNHPIGKIHIKYQLGDLKTRVTCFVINTESFNELLGHPRIHTNLIVSSTLHQCFKNVDR